MKKSGFELLWVFTFILVMNTCLAQEKYLLDYRYEKGKIYKYMQESKFESVLEMSGQEMKNVGNTLAVSKIDVHEIHANGDQSVSLSYEDYRVVTKMGTIDTTLEMKDMIGRESKLLLSRFGDVSAYQDHDSAETGGNAATSGIFSSDLTKELVRFPEYPVGIGERWDEEKQDTASGTELVTKTRAEYLLAGEEQKNNHVCLKITYKGTSEISGKVTQMGMEFFMEGEGVISGSIWYDRKSGILVARESLSEQDITMAMTGQMQMTIPMTTNISGKFALVE